MKNIDLTDFYIFVSFIIKNAVKELVSHFIFVTEYSPANYKNLFMFFF